MINTFAKRNGQMSDKYSEKWSTLHQCNNCIPLTRCSNAQTSLSSACLPYHVLMYLLLCVCVFAPLYLCICVFVFVYLRHGWWGPARLQTAHCRCNYCIPLTHCSNAQTSLSSAPKPIIHLLLPPPPPLVFMSPTYLMSKNIWCQRQAVRVLPIKEKLVKDLLFLQF